MPFCQCRVNVPVSQEQGKKLSASIGEALGFGEKFLLLDIQDTCHMILRGSSDVPIAYICLHIYGNEGHEGYGALTTQITRIVHEVLLIPPKNIYVHYTDIGCFGCEGRAFGLFT